MPLRKLHTTELEAINLLPLLNAAIGQSTKNFLDFPWPVALGQLTDKPSEEERLACPKCQGKINSVVVFFFFTVFSHNNRSIILIN